MRGCHVNHIIFSGYAGDLVFSIEDVLRDPSSQEEGSIIYDKEKSPFRASKTSKGHLLELKIDNNFTTIMILNSTMTGGAQVWYLNKELLSAEFQTGKAGDFCTLIVNRENNNRIVNDILNALKSRMPFGTYIEKGPSSTNLARYFRSFSLANFKAFGKEQQIPIRPLTLLFGPNSGGKSSIIQGLIFANEAVRTGNLNVYITQLGGSSIDLGGFQQYVHKRQLDRIFELSICLGADEFDPDDEPPVYIFNLDSVSLRLAIGMPLDHNGKPLRNGIPNISSFSVQGNGKMLFRIKSLPEGSLYLDEIDLANFLYLENFFISFSKDSLDEITREIKSEDRLSIAIQILSKIVTSLMHIEGEFFLPVRLSTKGISDEEFQSLVLGMFKPGEVADQRHSYNVVGTVRKLCDGFMKQYYSLLDDLELLLNQINRHFHEQLDRLQYLGPLRSYPSRDLASKENLDHNWFAGGGYAWDVVRKNADVRDKINKWLGDNDKLKTPYEFISQKFRPVSRANSYQTIQRLSLIDKRSGAEVSHRDVGIGISQVLPVLVSAYASTQKIIAMEQPEIHLHPALQAELADVFIESAVGQNQNTFLLETHSEHLLLRMMRRMRETANGTQHNPSLRLTPKDIVVLYVEPVGSQSIVREMPLNEYGELMKAWPGGFFEEGLREVF
jgi:hypothetical protein